MRHAGRSKTEMVQVRVSLDAVHQTHGMSSSYQPETQSDSDVDHDAADGVQDQ